jgi:hypothetical protein
MQVYGHTAAAACPGGYNYKEIRKENEEIEKEFVLLKRRALRLPYKKTGCAMRSCVACEPITITSLS